VAQAAGRCVGIDRGVPVTGPDRDIPDVSPAPSALATEARDRLTDSGSPAHGRTRPQEGSGDIVRVTTPVTTSTLSSPSDGSRKPRKLGDLDAGGTIYAGRTRLRALWTDWSVEVRVLSGALRENRTCDIQTLDQGSDVALCSGHRAKTAELRDVDAP
jgi:hypothetical protein